MTRRLTGFVAGSDDAERLVVGLSGAFITDGDRTWLLPVDVFDPILFNLAGAVSIESVLRVLARVPGQAVLVLGSDTSANERYGPFTRAGMGNLDAPNGVTIVNGTARATANLMKDMILNRLKCRILPSQRMGNVLLRTRCGRAHRHLIRRMLTETI